MPKWNKSKKESSSNTTNNNNKEEGGMSLPQYRTQATANIGRADSNSYLVAQPPPQPQPQPPQPPQPQPQQVHLYGTHGQPATIYIVNDTSLILSPESAKKMVQHSRRVFLFFTTVLSTAFFLGASNQQQRQLLSTQMSALQSTCSAFLVVALFMLIAYLYVLARGPRGIDIVLNTLIAVTLFVMAAYQYSRVSGYAFALEGRTSTECREYFRGCCPNASGTTLPERCFGARCDAETEPLNCRVSELDLLSSMFMAESGLVVVQVLVSILGLVVGNRK